MKEVVSIVKELIERFGKDDVGGMAAQLAYFFLLSLFPFMIFLVTLLGFINVDEGRVLAFISTYAPPEAFDLITNNVSSLLQNENGGILSIGIIGTLWAASNGVNAIIRAFNRAYEVKEDRHFLITRLIAIVLTISMVIVIGIALLLPVLGHSIGLYLFSYIGLSDSFITAWEALRWMISTVIFFIVLSFLFAMAPNKKIKYKNTSIGALFSTVSWQGTSLLFSFYVSNLGNYSSAYGSLGSVIVLMIWFYLTGVIIILGGEINAIIFRRTHGIESKA
ncbi:YihY/virulence factor BrkB family protein [Halobacillus litoralis]|uniref:YihY/virulence factor BrkB family protein n=1 Tax=Halobacillus litoralis TaxID=45668 RepID=UPI001CD5A0BA|nr:YihY/virulence factor BrkB family protein [Halobacillus litoralis]MCA0971926.1 YihY/virulence factor BrkB family protein [Halobacillus litoralis]